ncbi:hypothetical protein ABZX51_007080 [Aspergillus tubingensis]
MEEAIVERTSQVQDSAEDIPADRPDAYVHSEEVYFHASCMPQGQVAQPNLSDLRRLADLVETSPRASRSPSISSAVVESLPPMPSPAIHAVEPNEEEEDMEGIVSELLDRYTAA